jgi:hypothetical protein
MDALFDAVDCFIQLQVAELLSQWMTMCDHILQELQNKLLGCHFVERLQFGQLVGLKTKIIDFFGLAAGGPRNERKFFENF